MSKREVNVFGQMKIKTFQENFYDVFGVTIRLLKKDGGSVKKEDGLQNLSSVRDSSKNKKTQFSIGQAKVSIQTIEDRLYEETGVCIQILDGESRPVKDKKRSLSAVRSEYMSEEQRSAINVLKSSAMFELSLASKELFHSNFIYWLGNTYPDILKQVIRGWLNWKGSGSIEEIVSISRESKNLDILISYRKSTARSVDDVCYLIIENKVKSIPYFEQLNRYSKYIDESNGSGVLLTCVECKIIPPKWKEVTYADYLEKLEEVLKKEKIPLYHKELIQDYIRFTNALVELLGSVKKKNRYFLQREFKKEVSSLRIHDLFLKNQAFLLANDVLKKLKTEVGSVGIGNPANPKGLDVVVEHGYFKHQICSVFRCFEIKQHRFFVGVQLDGSELRLCSYAPCIDNQTTLSEKLSEKASEYWSNNLDLTFLKPTKSNKNRINTIGLYEYKNQIKSGLTGLFLYTKCDIKKSHNKSTIPEIADLITTYFLRIYEHQNDISEWLKNELI